MLSNYKISYILILLLCIVGVSCQKEASEIITPDSQESLGSKYMLNRNLPVGIPAFQILLKVDNTLVPCW